MIETLPDDTRTIDFADWTPEMVAASSALFKLPRRPGDTAPGSHEFGIDRLSRIKNGHAAVKLVHVHSRYLDHCPTEREVISLGLNLLYVVGFPAQLEPEEQIIDELEQIVHDSRRQRSAVRSARRKAKPTLERKPVRRKQIRAG